MYACVLFIIYFSVLVIRLLKGGVAYPSEGYGATDVATYAHVKDYAVGSPVLLSSQFCASAVATAINCESLALGSQYASAEEEVSDGVFIGHNVMLFWFTHNLGSPL